MNLNKFPTIAATIFLLISMNSASLASEISLPAEQNTITSKLIFENDPRLQQKISITAETIYLGELLELVSKQTGISFISSDKDKGAGLPLTVHLRNRSAADFMKALSSFVSYKSANCYWESNPTSSGAFSYRFVRPLNSINLPEYLKSKEEEEYLRHATSLLDIARQTKGKFDTLQSSNSLENTFLSRCSDRTKNGINALSQILSNDEFSSLIKKNGSMTLPFDSLSESAKLFVTDTFTKANQRYVDADGNERGKIPFPKAIKIRASNDDSPNVFIEIGEGGGYNYIGGNRFNTYFNKMMNDDWLLSKDSRHHSIQEQEIFSSSTVKPNNNRLELLYLAKQLDIPLIAAAPLGEGILKSVASQPLKNILEYLSERSEKFAYKWNGEFLLLAYNRWFLRDMSTQRVHWDTLKSLRASSPEYRFVRKFTLSLPRASVVLEAARDASLSEIKAMSVEFPFMEDLLSWQPLLHALSKRETNIVQVQTERGIPITSLKAALDQCPLLRGHELEFAKAKSIRIAIQEFDIQAQRNGKRINSQHKALALLFLDGSGKTIVTFNLLTPSIN